jgi:hypothetical protein
MPLSCSRAIKQAHSAGQRYLVLQLLQGPRAGRLGASPASIEAASTAHEAVRSQPQTRDRPRLVHTLAALMDDDELLNASLPLLCSALEADAKQAVCVRLPVPVQTSKMKRSCSTTRRIFCRPIPQRTSVEHARHGTAAAASSCHGSDPLFIPISVPLESQPANSLSGPKVVPCEVFSRTVIRVPCAGDCARIVGGTGLAG